MQPDTPPPPQNPYEFIMNSGEQSKKTLLPGGGNTKQRIMLVGGGGAVLLIVFMVIFSLLMGGNKGNEQVLIGLAQQQTELVRVAAIGVTKAKSPNTQNLAITTQLSVSSAQKDLLTLIKKQKIKLDPKILTQTKNTKTDTQLTAAEQDNRFDETFTLVLQQQLSAYALALKNAFNESTGINTRQALSEAAKNAELLTPKQTTQPAVGT